MTRHGPPWIPSEIPSQLKYTSLHVLLVLVHACAGRYTNSYDGRFQENHVKSALLSCILNLS
jgi:hypothetical protein